MNDKCLLTTVEWTSFFFFFYNVDNITIVDVNLRIQNLSKEGMTHRLHWQEGCILESLDQCNRLQDQVRSDPPAPHTILSGHNRT